MPLAALLALGTAQVALAQVASDPGQAAYTRAQELQRRGRHREAAAAFEEAYRLRARRELVYVIIGRSADGSSRPMLDDLSRILDTRALEAPTAPGVDVAAAEGTEPTSPGQTAAIDVLPSPVVIVDEAPPEASEPPEPEPLSDAIVEGDEELEDAVEEGILAAIDDTASETAEEEPRQSEVGVLSWSLAALGGAGLIGGGITGLMALETGDELSRLCPGGACPASEADRLERAQILAGVTNGLFIGGGTALIAGITIGLLWPDGDDEAPEPTVACGADGCQVGLRGTF